MLVELVKIEKGFIEKIREKITKNFSTCFRKKIQQSLPIMCKLNFWLFKEVLLLQTPYMKLLKKLYIVFLSFLTSQTEKF